LKIADVAIKRNTQQWDEGHHDDHPKGR
jgi:hypothetical protein